MQQQITFQIDSSLYEFLNSYSVQSKKPISVLFEDFIKNLSLRTKHDNFTSNNKENEYKNLEITKFIRIINQFNSIEESDLEVDVIFNERENINERKFSFD